MFLASAPRGVLEGAFNPQLLIEAAVAVAKTLWYKIKTVDAIGYLEKSRGDCSENQYACVHVYSM